MTSRWLLRVALLASIGLSSAHAETREMQVPRFGKVVVYQPQGEPKSVTLFLSGAGMTAPDIRDLPLTETPATMPSNRIAVLLTGDGGWAGLDRNVAAQLAARGLSTVGFDSLRYFWQARTAEETAKDLERVLRHYLASWRAERFVLVGYSFGADALPFIVRRLPADLRARLVTMNLLGLSQSASFEVHVTDWIPGVESRGEPVQPELLQLTGVRTLCLYGDGEQDALCPSLPADRVTSERVGSGHHFSGDYTALADRILRFARSAN
jgi:type IV secretory pathway VirJ component